MPARANTASAAAMPRASSWGASGLPGGATSLREGHGDWTVSCNLATQNGANVKVCALSQEQTDSQSRQRVLAMELRPAGETVQGMLVLPFGLALEKGVTLR
ncbi:hypothetical protein FJ938_27220 [Mesorhizobium sp. B2-4-14]|nr:hypothetical protein FJ938_27220 [Mesorhizobium sp. B2-4-14]